MEEIQKHLFELQDMAYRDFHSRLMPDSDKETIIGIRVPMLRKYAKSIAGTELSEKFIKELPHHYYEENNLHMMLITRIKDYDRCISEIERFLPYVDNWATCDLMSPKIFAKHTDELFIKIKLWIKSDKVYTVRYGIGMLMRYFLDESFEESYLELVANITSEEYYINMMIAWYFATALAKQYDSAIKFIEQHKLNKWTHNKAIQKAIESLRINPEQKAYLRTLKIK